MANYVREIAFIGIVFSIICSTTYAEVAPWKECPSENADAPTNCTIHELRVKPCKEGAESKPCRLKRGTNASIEFDYTANFEAATLEGSAYWVNSLMELPFMGMESDACLSTVCPTIPNQKQVYHQNFEISKKYPTRTYDVKWKLVGPSGAACCFIFQIKIHK